MTLTGKINALTPAQADELPRFRDEWLQVGLSTQRVDRARSTAAIKALYLAAGKDEPDVWHFDSPAQCCLALSLIRNNLGANLGANLRDNLWDNLGDNLGDNLLANLRANLRDNLRDNLLANLRANLRDNLRDNLWDNLRDNLWDNLRDNLWDNLRANLGDNLYESTPFWGGQDAPWLAFYQFGQKIGVTYSRQEHFDAYIEYARSSGWMFAFKGIAFASDRPCVIKKDGNTRLHCETGPAILFTDGYAVHAWHGQNVPAAWIENPHQLTAKEALGQENTSLRIAAMQIVGWPKMIDQLSPRVVNRHPEGMAGGELLGIKKSIFTPGARGEMRFLKAECPRNGIICFRVPDDTKTAHEAQAWAAGLPSDAFSLPSVRT